MRQLLIEEIVDRSEVREVLAEIRGISKESFSSNAEYNVFGIAKFDASLPLQKKLIDHTNYLKPVISFRYSPNGNSNLTSKDIFLNYDSAFNLNRIGTSYEVEGGESISFGMEFKRDNDKGDNIFELNKPKTKKINAIIKDHILIFSFFKRG